MKGQNNAILLVTDGIEECGGDPCAAAKQVKASGLSLKVDVVGLNLNSQQRAAIDCLAKETGGKFFSADKAADFASTLKKAVQVAEADTMKKPAPKPTSTRVFFDHFKGDKLSANWTVTNPDTDSYIVEDGDLLMVSSTVTGFSDPKMSNLVTLKRTLPKGDWDMHVNVTPELKSGRDQIWVGLRKDDKNYLAARFWSENGNTECLVVSLTLQRSSHGKLTRFNRAIRDFGCAPPTSVAGTEASKKYNAFINALKKTPVTITLSKRGHSYDASLEIQGEISGQKPVVYATEPLTSLRPPGPPTLAVGKWQKTNGEISASVNSIEIDTVQNAGQ